MKLEELVPPLELCKLIPAGEFEESAFMRGLHAEFDTVIHRENLHIFTVNGEAFFPAPTLEEILAAFERNFVICEIWRTGQAEINCNDEATEVTNWSVSAAALRLWFRIREAEKE